MLCVLLTCVDVAGFMHCWGITIEITSMNILIISVGLCVDFCAHIMHGFLITPGSRDKRVLHIMENIAPAVMNGGFSSLLALSLLVSSHSHIFISFFKIFFMICVFGLFHGLILLPVVLCILGPSGPSKKDEEARKKAVEQANAKDGIELPSNGNLPKDVKKEIKLEIEKHDKEERKELLNGTLKETE